MGDALTGSGSSEGGDVCYVRYVDMDAQHTSAVTSPEANTPKPTQFAVEETPQMTAAEFEADIGGLVIIDEDLVCSQTRSEEKKQELPSPMSQSANKHDGNSKSSKESKDSKRLSISGISSSKNPRLESENLTIDSEERREMQKAMKVDLGDFVR